MRLHLVSLALLLLALCRSSAGLGYSVVSKNTQSSTSSIAFTKPAEKEKIVKTTSDAMKSEPDAAAQEKYLNLIGNTLFVLGFHQAGIINNLAPTFKDALANGVLCEFEHTDKLIEKMKAINYNHDKEMEAFNERGAKCSDTTKDDVAKKAQDCFCLKKDPLVYCLLFQLPEMFRAKNLTQKTCRKDALDKFKEVGPELFKAYDLDNFGTDKYTDFFKGDVDGASKTAAAMFCDALNPKVQEAVEKVYAADALYWIAESVLYTIVFGVSEKSALQICQEPDFANNEYGKCMCPLKTGFSFCIYKVFAQYFKDAKYLKCPSPEEPEILVAAYVEGSKPTAPPPKLAQRGSASPNSAATSSLLLAPLTAAAVMLLRL